MKTVGVRRFGSGMALVAAASLVLSGCSGGTPPDNGTPSASPPASSGNAGGSPSASAAASSASPTSASASPTPVPASSKGPAKNWPVPKMPAEAKKNTPEGAAAFAEYYFELIEYTGVTNDASRIEELTEKRCDICVNSVIMPAKKNRLAGAWIAGGEYDVKVLSARKVDRVNGSVSFSFTQSELKGYNSDGHLNFTQPASDSPIIGSFVLEHSKGWSVALISFADG